MTHEERMLLWELSIAVSQQLDREGFPKGAAAIRERTKAALNPPQKPALRCPPLWKRALAGVGLLALAGCGGNYVTTEGEAPTYRQQAMFGLGSALLLQSTQPRPFIPAATPVHCMSQAMGYMTMMDCQ